MHVANSGALAGSEVVQVYLAYPMDAGEPKRVLRGFHRTAVLAARGDAEAIPFTLSRRDLSIWSDGNGTLPRGWQIAMGTFGVHIGASSRDIRLHWEFEVGHQRKIAQGRE